tara:strand:- start:114 stop:281 length:168 start_codon:yes stop_codon:yes gene_type:complete
MIIKEFISETNRNQMIADLLKYYKVGSVKVKQKSMKDMHTTMLIPEHWSYLHGTK